MIETGLNSVRFLPSVILVLESFKVSWAKAAKVLKEFEELMELMRIQSLSGTL